MLFLHSKRSLSSLLLRSTSHLRGDAISSSSCSSSFSNLDGVGRSGIRTLHSLSMLLRNGHLCCSKGTLLDQERVLFSIFRRFSDASGSGGDTPPPRLDRNFLAKLWVSDMKKLKEREKRFGKASTKHRGENAVYEQSSLAHSDETHYEPILQQPPVSQSMSGPLKPKTLDEAKIATLLARSNLLITRDIEWANLVLGFEQENRYAVVDVCYPEAPVGSIREQSHVIARQLLRTRRPFVASITDALGNELFRVRRPFWWITSSIYAEIDGEEIGVVHRRWHLWRRIYDLYLGNQQFAVVENPGFWNWTFTVKDADGEVLAQIDRDWRGFGFEILTDAGQYVIRFGKSDAAFKSGPAKMIEELLVKRPLTLSERAVVVALAISLDNDYFSRHGGWGIPFMAVGE
ncbi:hypothetical protein HID58_011796 [Brassica napus]|uniref:Phospholipid scramblase n=1 Tax=Brassica napus TaxID=3708 RepID=A0ABQ8DZB2_BRANA|nr:altered inheritance rate of mitochondria protein 25-like [Brassica napus]KAH0934679.1 hypothetical protein HID58_011796 [Brassica napus]